MGITEKQKEMRKNSLGGSDMAAIMGVSKFKSAYDVWLEKTCRVQEQPDNQPMYTGRLLESAVLNFAEDRIGKILRNQRRRAPFGLPICANIDGILNPKDGKACPVEAKTSGLFGLLSPEWGEEGTDQVPDNIIIQAHTEMLCLEPAETCYVPALLGSRGFQMFIVRRNNQLIEQIMDMAVEFWEKHVETDLPPEGKPSLEQAKRVIREPNKIVNIEAALVEAWQIANESKKEAEKILDEAKAAVLGALIDAEIGQCDIGAVTYFGSTVPEHTVKEFTRRVLLFKKGEPES